MSATVPDYFRDGSRIASIQMFKDFSNAFNCGIGMCDVSLEWEEPELCDGIIYIVILYIL